MREYIHRIYEEVIFLITLALPVSIECFSQGLQMKVSNIFVGRASGNDIVLMLSALFMGQTTNVLIAYPIAEGFGVYVNILCSQAYGAKQYKLVGLYFYRALFMATLTCFPVFTIYISVRPIIYFLFQDLELAQYAGSFTDVLCFGYPAYLYYKIGLRFLQALNIAWGPVLYLIIGNILNGVIQYILIFQYNKNIEGAAAGYVISNYLVALLVFTHIQLSHVHSTIAQKWSVEYITNWLHTAKYAIVPITQFIIGIGPVTINPILFIGLMSNDKRELAIYSILYSIWWVCSIGTMGFSSAITVRVGNLLGANQPKKAKQAAPFGIICGQLTMVLCNIIIFTISEPLSHLFTTDPVFARQLTWNIRLFSFFLNTDVKLVVQGVMNACCKQGIQLILKFVFQIIIGTVATVLLVHFVHWKALSVLVQFSVTNIICCVIALTILFRSKWENIALFVLENTQMKETNNVSLEEDQTNLTRIRELVNKKEFQLVRYSISLILSVFIFDIIIWCNN